MDTKVILKRLGINSSGIELLKEFIDWRWVAAMVLLPTFIFILDVIIVETWIITFYVIVFVLLLTGFIRFVQLKKHKTLTKK